MTSLRNRGLGIVGREGCYTRCVRYLARRTNTPTYTVGRRGDSAELAAIARYQTRWVDYFVMGYGLEGLPLMLSLDMKRLLYRNQSRLGRKQLGLEVEVVGVLSWYLELSNSLKVKYQN